MPTGWNFEFALLVLLISALNKKKRRRIFETLRTVNWKSRRNPSVKIDPTKGFALGLLRLVAINCRCISEDNGEYQKKTIRTIS